MKKYDKYKPTGSPWIGDVPEHWEVKRFRFVCNYKKGKNPKKLVFDFEDGMKPYLSMDYLRGTSNDVEYTFHEEGLVESKAGDLLLLWDGSNAGEFIISKDGYLSSTCALLSNKFESNSYFGYLCNVSEKYLKDMTNGMGIPHVDSNVFKNLTAIIPSQSEQESIVAYLDEKCGSVDKVIAKQERRIALLKELKQSIISEAVTRGINPEAPLKATGIEWIGQIPEHWEVMPLKRTGSFGNGLTYSPDELCDEDGILVLRSSNIQNDKLCFEDNVYVKGCSDSLMVTPGDIIICSRNGSASLVGKCAMVENELYATFGAFMMRYRPLRKANKKFSYYMLQAALKLHKGLYSTTTINQLTNAVIDQITVSYPPFSEQEVIAKYLDEKCGRFDILISKATREIELLKEYKQSIITEAVTGKIKVC